MQCLHEKSVFHIQDLRVFANIRRRFSLKKAVQNKEAGYAAPGYAVMQPFLCIQEILMFINNGTYNGSNIQNCSNEKLFIFSKFNENYLKTFGNEGHDNSIDATEWVCRIDGWKIGSFSVDFFKNWILVLQKNATFTHWSAKIIRNMMNQEVDNAKKNLWDTVDGQMLVDDEFFLISVK